MVPPVLCADTVEENLYTTGKVMEVDRCASAWLIKRFIDKEAVFKLYSKDSLITTGIVFDRPEAKLRRTHKLATFEVILRKYSVEDDRLSYIGELIHDIEINFWGKRKFPESKKIEAAVREQINDAQDSVESLNGCFLYFDRFFRELADKQ